MQLTTGYDLGEIPFNEHPNPQLQREKWTNLNGKWDLKKLSSNGETLFNGTILVPFSPETINSGIEKGFVLESGQTLVYNRFFELKKEDLEGQVIIHFGAVDSECEVYINDNLVGCHLGGFTPFEFEIASFLVGGENRLTVKVKDEAIEKGWARGKQSKKRGGIWYTPQSGIWQTVWLEFLPLYPITNLKITPIFNENKVNLTFNSKSKVKAIVLDNGKEILALDGEEKIELAYNFEPWTPENPKLYDLVLENQSGDKINSYFGFRSFEIVKDKTGKKRLGLNGKPYFYNGVLDQGYWSDGMLTYPSDKAIIDELTMLKDMGFNTVRKHIKLEPMRWYYHCDRLGLAVWQDFVNGGGDYNFFRIALFPQMGFNRHRDNDYKFFARESEDAKKEYYQMMDEIVKTLYNCVSVGVYVPFNEGWGQFDSGKVTRQLEKLDPTRIIDSVSGWHDQGKDQTRIKSMHIYFTPLRVPKDERAVVLSEFGGYSYKVKGHVFDEEKTFGYRQYKTQEKYIKAVEKLFTKKIIKMIKKGLSASIYTQVSDVEEEINGLVTYDRKVQKIPTEKMREINDKLKEVWKVIE